MSQFNENQISNTARNLARGLTDLMLYVHRDIGNLESVVEGNQVFSTLHSAYLDVLEQERRRILGKKSDN